MTGRAPPPQQSHMVHPYLHAHPQSAADMPLSITALVHLVHDAEHLTARYGSTSAACARLDELERAHVELQSQLATLQQKLNMNMVAAAAAQVDQSGAATGPRASGFDVDALLGFVQRHCACRGNIGLLRGVLQDFQRAQTLPPETRFPSRDVLLSVQEFTAPPSEPSAMQTTSSHMVQTPNSHAPNGSVGRVQPQNETAPPKKAQERPRLTTKSKASSASTTSSPARVHPNGRVQAPPPRPIAPATRPSGGAASQPSVERRSNQEEKQTANAAIVLSALSRPSSNGNSAKPTTTVPSNTPPQPVQKMSRKEAAKKRASQRSQAQTNAATSTTKQTETAPQPTEENGQAEENPVNKRKRSSSAAASATIPAHEIVVKQNLSLPHDKRNVVELKQSSQFLTLENLEELNRRAPWDIVYKKRANFSHILDYQTLEAPARKWFIAALRVQFVWRREFWERLHWLPMSEAVCVGPEWEKYRQTRKRRANKAIAAWRKIYGDSLELMRQRLLPEDVWCDVSLWYMPSTPLYWLPTSPDLEAELEDIDTKHPMRCYFAKEFHKHPFYNDLEIQRKYPGRYDLPPPNLLATQNEDRESRVNVTPA